MSLAYLEENHEEYHPLKLKAVFAADEFEARAHAEFYRWHEREWIFVGSLEKLYGLLQFKDVILPSFYQRRDAHQMLVAIKAIRRMQPCV